MRTIGIIGNGEVVQKHHIPAIRELGWKYSVCGETDNLVSFLGQKFDAISICTPNYLHIPQAIEALDKGHKVLLEKPLAVSREQSFRLMKHPRVAEVSVCFQRRYGQTAQEIKRDFQEIDTITAEICVRRDPQYWNTWRRDKLQSGGGALANIFVHYIDLILWWTKGSIKLNFAKTASREGTDQCVYSEFTIGKTKVNFFGSSIHPERRTTIQVWGKEPKTIAVYQKDEGTHKDAYEGLFNGNTISVAEAYRSLSLIESIYDYDNNTNK